MNMATIINLADYRETLDAEVLRVETLHHAKSPELLSFSFSPERSNLWAPQRSDDWGRDCTAGRGYAHELLQRIRDTGHTPLLGHVCGAMDRAAWGGVEVGFFQELAEQLEAPRRRYTD
jgi:hypothetical protein